MAMDRNDINFILTEMFKRVGLEYSPSFVSDPEWYLKHEWTEEAQDDFREWLILWLKKKFHFSKAQAEREAGWIILHTGWRVKTTTEATNAN